jgi:hypothetical protein
MECGVVASALPPRVTQVVELDKGVLGEPDHSSARSGDRGAGLMDGGSARDLRIKHHRRVRAQLTGLCATAHSPGARIPLPFRNIFYICIYPKRRICAGISAVSRVSRRAAYPPRQTGRGGSSRVTASPRDLHTLVTGSGLGTYPSFGANQLGRCVTHCTAWYDGRRALFFADDSASWPGHRVLPHKVRWSGWMRSACEPASANRRGGTSRVTGRPRDLHILGYRLWVAWVSIVTRQPTPRGRRSLA